MKNRANDIFIIIGCMYLPEDEEYLKRTFLKKETSVSNCVFERKLFKGFCEVAPNSTYFVSAPSIGWFPFNCKKPFIKGFSSKNNFISVKYLSTYFGSHIFKSIALKKALKSIIKKNNNKDTKFNLIINEMHLPYLKCAKYFKKQKKNSTTIQLVPDLPAYNNRSKNLLYKLFKKINCLKIENYRKKFIDKYVLFSDCMAEELQLSANDFIVNYGIATPKKEKQNKFFSDNLKHLVFLGKLDNRNGIDKILQIAKKFDNDIVFDFFGIGASDSISKDKQISSSNINFHGFLEPSTVPDLIEDSSLLFSLRDPNDEYTKYSFPSKMFDYLLSTKPIITFNLLCYPSFFGELVTYPRSSSEEDLIKTIKQALQDDFFVNINKRKHFLEEYSPSNVALRIMELVVK